MLRHRQFTGRPFFVLADCSVFLLDKDTGEIFQHKVVGHTPYSAVSFGTNKALIGAGEPPANGQLICFDVVSEAHVSLPMYNDVYFLEEKRLQSYERAYRNRWRIYIFEY